MENQRFMYRYSESWLEDAKVGIHLETYTIRKETPKGFWISSSWWPDGLNARWVSKKGRKRFAHETKEEAWYSYQRRKKKQVSILEWQLTKARASYQASTMFAAPDKEVTFWPEDMEGKNGSMESLHKLV